MRSQDRVCDTLMESRATEGVGQLAGGTAGGAKALRASVPPGGAAEAGAGEVITARPVGLEVVVGRVLLRAEPCRLAGSAVERALRSQFLRALSPRRRDWQTASPPSLSLGFGCCASSETTSLPPTAQPSTAWSCC